MKFIDYIYESTKNEMMNVLEPHHDTIYGAFVKGIRHALETQDKWIKDEKITPEKFDEFKRNDIETSPVLIKHNMDGEEVLALGCRLFVDGAWGWYVPGSEIRPAVLEWKRL